MSRRICLFLALLGASSLVAQSQAESDFKTLAAEFEKARADSAAATKKITNSEEYKALAKARDREGTRKLMSTVERPDMQKFASRFAAGAEKYAGKPEALPYLMWLATTSGLPKYEALGVNKIVESHADSDQLEELIEFMPRLARNKELGDKGLTGALDRILEKNKSPLVLANVHFAKANMTKEADAKEAHMAKVMELAPPRSLVALKAKAPQFEKERLQIGMEAPDISGEDLDGQAFKLSDYRGKVVVIDFWGDW